MFYCLAVVQFCCWREPFLRPPQPPRPLRRILMFHHIHVLVFWSTSFNVLCGSWFHQWPMLSNLGWWWYCTVWVYICRIYWDSQNWVWGSPWTNQQNLLESSWQGILFGDWTILALLAPGGLLVETLSHIPSHSETLLGGSMMTTWPSITYFLPSAESRPKQLSQSTFSSNLSNWHLPCGNVTCIIIYFQ